MRADRLLSLMLLLQAQGQMTAGQLATALHVSERTIYRDVDALSLAGIPIYTQDGRGGGIALEENYRVSLTGLTKSEVQALFVSGSVAPLDDLGLADANETTLLKLLTALPSLHRAEAERVRQRIYIDPSDWFSSQAPSPYLAEIQEAVLSDTILILSYQRQNGDIFTREIAPYGMVAKSNVWYLVGAHDDNFRTYRLSRIMDIQSTGHFFQRDPQFKLIDFWEANAQSFLKSLSQYPVQIAVRASRRAELANHMLFTNADFIPTGNPDWLAVTLMFDTQEQAITGLIGIVRDIQIVDPPGLKVSLLAYARDVVSQLESE